MMQFHWIDHTDITKPPYKRKVIGICAILWHTMFYPNDIHGNLINRRKYEIHNVYQEQSLPPLRNVLCLQHQDDYFCVNGGWISTSVLTSERAILSFVHLMFRTEGNTIPL